MYLKKHSLLGITVLFWVIAIMGCSEEKTVPISTPAVSGGAATQ